MYIFYYGKSDRVSDASDRDVILVFTIFFFMHSRFQAGKIYTYIGEVCVSVNPYRQMNIYGPDYVNKYKGNSTST